MSTDASHGLDLFLSSLIPLMWILWGAYWLISARRQKTNARVESSGSRAAHIIPLVIAACLLFFDRLPGDFLGGRFLPATLTTYFSGVAIVALGLGFSIWARRTLGRNWSGIVTLKQDHELVRSGPYRWVRHPIYTGLVFAFVGCAIARGEWRGILAVAIVFVALWRKLRLEERWMLETFGDAYVRYKSEVPALIPFVI
jgi:protein-S-isoprenylcysteine O-methyltransferase Ste14